MLNPENIAYFLQTAGKVYKIIPPLFHLIMLENLAQDWTGPEVTSGVVSKVDLQNHVQIVLGCFLGGAGNIL